MGQHRWRGNTAHNTAFLMTVKGDIHVRTVKVLGQELVAYLHRHKGIELVIVNLLDVTGKLLVAAHLLLHPLTELILELVDTNVCGLRRFLVDFRMGAGVSAVAVLHLFRHLIGAVVQGGGYKLMAVDGLTELLTIDTCGAVLLVAERIALVKRPAALDMCQRGVLDV